MTFDLSKFYQARVTRDQLRGMLATLRRLDEFVKKAARQRLVVRLLGALACVVVALATYAENPLLLAVTAALSLLGLTFVYVTSLVRGLFSPKSVGEIVSSLVLLVVPGCFLYFVTYAAWQATRELLGDPHLTLPAAAIATGFVAYLFLAASGVKWGELEPQKVEMDYLEQVALPLFGDLPKNTRGELVFNPFRGEWSQVSLPTPRRAGYTFKATADIILRLRLPLDEHRDLRLSVVEQALSKTKDRKSKYKGTKRRLLVRYDMQLAPGAELDAGVAVEQALGALAIPSRVAVDKGRVTVVQVKKSADMSRDLRAEHLVPAAQVLATIRAVSEASRPR